MKDFKPSPMNHGKGSVAGQLIPVEYNRLTVSEAVSIDEPAGGYMEMLEYRNSARGYVMALKDKSAMEGYLETMCKILNIPMEVKTIWARRRLMPWFRANMTAWLYEYAKKHMSKHGRVYSEYQLDIGAGAFKRAFVTHRNAVTTAVKRISRTSERSGKEKAEMLKEDSERNVTLCLHNSFCRNR